MDLAGFTAGEWLVLVQYELLLFAGLFFLFGALDELAVDLVWLWLRFTGRAATISLEKGIETPAELSGKAAILIPAWAEERVIATTIAHTLRAWPQAEYRLYVGCYPNDPATIAKVVSSGLDHRVRLIVHERAGPTTKADCLNSLYRALARDEARSGSEYRMVLLHDAEDMVDPAALALLDRAIEHADFVQLPVMPEPQRRSRWIAGHYCDEFAEAHGKAMVVRDALGAGLPSAGVGCAVKRIALARLAEARGDGVPFAADSLTEDYELGLGIGRQGGVMRFLRVRDNDGQLVATRACFPSTIATSVRQKTRWLHGIAFQGWDRLGWSLSLAESWMRFRDRRGPLTALLLALAYLLLFLSFASWMASTFGLAPKLEITSLLGSLLAFNFASLVWRATFRFAFTAREYGWREGLLAVARIPVANVIAIMAGRRALSAYIATLGGRGIAWDKTSHIHHPALPASYGLQRRHGMSA